MIIKHVRPLLAALLVTLACAGAARGEALTFSPVPAENIEFVSEGGLTLEAAEGAMRVVCNVTLSGSMRETSFAMVEGTEFGSVNRSSVSGCTGGALSFLRLAEAPASLTYRSFLGTLPELTAIRHRFGALKIQSVTVFGTCLYTGDVDALMELREINAWTVGTSTIVPARLTLVSGTLCPATATLTGRMALQNMQVALAPIMQWSPAFINFGEVRVGNSEARTADFENIAGAEISITEVRKRGAGCASFIFTNGNGALAAGRNLVANGRIEITATFRPAGVGKLVCDYEVKARKGAGAVNQRSLIVWGRGV